MDGIRIRGLFLLATILFLNREDRWDLYTQGTWYKAGLIDGPRLSKKAMKFWPWMLAEMNKS